MRNHSPLVATLLFVTACGSGASSPDSGVGTIDAAAAIDATIDATSPDAGPLPAGARKFSMEVNEPENTDHGNALALAMGAGASGTQLTMTWSTLEPTAGQQDLTFLQFGLEFYRGKGAELLLSIPANDTVEKTVPLDLAGIAMDDPAMISRYKSLVSAVLAVAGPEVKYLVIANEVDILLGSESNAVWTELEGFVEAIVPYVHGIRSDIKVGISASYGGIPDARIASIFAKSDVAFLNYYFTGNEFSGTPAESIGADVQKMINFANGTPIVFKEWGYSTGAATGGTDAGQLEFIAETFTVWDKHASEVEHIVFSRLYDDKRSDCEDQAEYYGLPGNEELIQFLCTLGLNRYDQTAKPAWTTLTDAASVRGF